MKLLLALSFLLSCSLVDKEQCENANWLNVGLLDAKDGKSIDTLFKRKDICSKYSVVLDENKYRLGFNNGLKKLCSSDNGFSLGKRGENPTFTCDKKVFLDYHSSYALGLKSFCSVENAKQLGFKGRSYPDVCQPNHFFEFYKTYTLFKKQFETNNFLSETRHEHFLVHEKIHLNARRISCSSDIQCEQLYFCSFNKCSRTGRACTFNSDCSIKGICFDKGYCRF